MTWEKFTCTSSYVPRVLLFPLSPSTSRHRASRSYAVDLPAHPRSQVQGPADPPGAQRRAAPPDDLQADGQEARVVFPGRLRGSERGEPENFVGQRGLEHDLRERWFLTIMDSIARLVMFMWVRVRLSCNVAGLPLRTVVNVFPQIVDYPPTIRTE